MGVPCPAKALLGFQNQKTRIRILLGEVISGADAGDPGADDDDIDMFGGVFDGRICGDFPGRSWSSRILFRAALLRAVCGQGKCRKSVACKGYIQGSRQVRVNSTTPRGQ